MPHLVNLVCFYLTLYPLYIDLLDTTNLERGCVREDLDTFSKSSCLLTLPYFLTDPLMSECLIYQLKPGKTLVSRLYGEWNIALGSH